MTDGPRTALGQTMNRGWLKYGNTPGDPQRRGGAVHALAHAGISLAGRQPSKGNAVVGCMAARAQGRGPLKGFGGANERDGSTEAIRPRNTTIAFTSTRDDHKAIPRINAAEIYLMDYLTDGSLANARRLTENSDADLFPTLSTDGKGKIVFDSNRLRAPGEQVNTSDLFLMNHDGTELTFLTRGTPPHGLRSARMVRPRRKSHSVLQRRERGSRSRTTRGLRPRTATSSS